MKRAPRGSLYVLVLLLTSLLLVLGMVYLATQGPEAQASQEVVDSAQAYQLARAGIDEARLKLSKDRAFPPDGGREQTTFSYAETVREGPNEVGTYRVTIDFAHAGPPHLLYEIRSEGFVNPPHRATAQSQIRVWLSAVDMKVVRWDE
jgi:type II secretory pathway component PulK